MTRRLAAVLWLGVLPLHVGCVGALMHAGTATATPDSDAPASLSVDGRDYALAVCHSGDRSYFLGVDLEDHAEQAALRVLVEPIDGPRLKVVLFDKESPKSIKLDRNSCRRLDVEVQPTGWRVNEVVDLSGSVDADCTSDSGIEVVAHAQFKHCH
jgi:hypothetical protein